MTLKTGLNLVGAFFWIISAGLWIVATYVVRYPKTPAEESAILAAGGWLPAQVTELDTRGKAVDVFGTSARQVKWNRYAAMAAAVAAICQGSALTLPGC